MKSVNVTIRMDQEVKERAEALFGELGMSMTTAINVFLRQAIRQNSIPFTITAFSKVPERPDDEADLEDLF